MVLALTLTGFATAAAFSPFWGQHRPVEIGLLARIVGLPPLLVIVLGCLRRSQQHLVRLYREMERLAWHDSLAGLPHGALLQEGLAQSLATAQRHHRPLAGLCVYLDAFKSVNDSFGHAAGDQLLCLAAERLRLCVRRSDPVAPIGGDAFVLVLTEMQVSENALVVAVKGVCALPEEAFSVRGRQTVQATTSLGVAIYPERGENPACLLAHADTALYRANRLGRNRWCRFSPEWAPDARGGALEA